MGGVGYHSGCGNGAAAEAERTSFPQIYGNLEKVKRRTVVRLIGFSGDLTFLDVIEPYL
jgi:hypothetical protein